LELGNPNGGLKDILMLYKFPKEIGKKKILYFPSNLEGLCQIYIVKGFEQPLENGFPVNSWYVPFVGNFELDFLHPRHLHKVGGSESDLVLKVTSNTEVHFTFFNVPTMYILGRGYF